MDNITSNLCRAGVFFLLLLTTWGDIVPVFGPKQEPVLMTIVQRFDKRSHSVTWSKDNHLLNITLCLSTLELRQNCGPFTTHILPPPKPASNNGQAGPPSPVHIPPANPVHSPPAHLTPFSPDRGQYGFPPTSLPDSFPPTHHLPAPRGQYSPPPAHPPSVAGQFHNADSDWKLGWILLLISYMLLLLLLVSFVLGHATSHRLVKCCF